MSAASPTLQVMQAFSRAQQLCYSRRISSSTYHRLCSIEMPLAVSRRLRSDPGQPHGRVPVAGVS